MWPRQTLAAVSLCAIVASGAARVCARAQSNEVELGAQRFMEFCAGCHGADGKGGDKAPSLLSFPNLAVQSDAELDRIVHDGTTAGMPPFAQIGEANIEAVVHYVRLLRNQAAPPTPSEAPIAGNAEAGRGLFFGKARCSECHMMEGKGGFIAGSLTIYGRNRGADAIRHAITHPDDPLFPLSQVVTATTAAGQRLTGVLRSEDNFTVALQTQDGRYHLLKRNDLKEVRYSGHSLMPRDYAKRLTPEELDDVVCFIILAGKRASSNR